jgi:inosine-uridine nucleoside N-ribohydrolase
LGQTRAVPPTERLPIVLDCDPGHDDAVALAVAARHCDVRGVTTVAGNVGLAHTTNNALALVQLLDLDVEVHAGAPGPRAGGAVNDASHVHGESGLAGAVMPEVTRTVASHDAAGFLVETARAVDGVWIIATGPMTNVAAAIDRDPDLPQCIAGISIMGGGTFGNVTAAAEFNVHYDPEAAAVVLASGARLVVCGLDLTHQVLVDDDLVARLAAAPNHFGPFAAGFLGEYLSIARTRFRSNIDAALHDPCAVLALTHAELFQMSPRRVVVETAGEHTRGMTVVDRRPITSAPNVEWAERIDAPAALAVVADALTSAP